MLNTESFHKSIAASALGMSSAMSPKVVRTREATLASGNVAQEGSLLGVNFCVTLEMLQASEGFTTGLASMGLGLC